jgi:hypothetical protein
MVIVQPAATAPTAVTVNAPVVDVAGVTVTLVPQPEPAADV